MTDRASRLRSAVARRLGPRGVGQQADEQQPDTEPDTEPAAPAGRREVRAFLDALDGAQAGGPMQESVARAFRRLWQPRSEPTSTPPAVVLDSVRDQFHLLFHHVSRRTWKDTFYRGTRVHAWPTDLWVRQQLVDDLRPGLVVETGTFRGGTALHLADRLQLAGRGQVVSIDPEALPKRPPHPRLTYLTGSATDPAVLDEVRGFVDPALPVLVFLGSGGSQAQVEAELAAYAPLVTAGSYVVVDHTHLSGHPVAPDGGPGPFEAVRSFLDGTDEFEVDERGERYFLTRSPGGHLKRVRPPAAGPATGGEVARTAPLELGPAWPAVRALDQLTFDAAETDASVVLVLQAFEPGQFFAGIRTAVLAGARLADELDRPLRVLVVSPARSTDHDAAHAALADLVRAEGLPGVADGLRLSTDARRDAAGHSTRDVWLATYWTTAHALAAQARTGRVEAGRVVYLVQDYEPGFYPWGPDHAQALATYDAGFRPLVNSGSLARYLGDLTTARPEAVFAPALDPAPLHEAAARWRPPAEGEVRVLFYARPGKPRNMYDAGLTALRLWADRLPDGLGAVVRLAGEDLVGEVDLGHRARVEVRGKLSYDGYHDLLAETDLGLALMLSPHPGHLALELPMAGIPTVTNQFAGYRDAWIEGLSVAATDPHTIADALLALTPDAVARTEHRPSTLGDVLGGTLDEAVRTVARSLPV